MSGLLRYLALLAFTAAAHAGFDEGEQAFKRRDFRTALSEFHAARRQRQCARPVAARCFGEALIP